MNKDIESINHIPINHHHHPLLNINDVDYEHENSFNLAVIIIHHNTNDDVIMIKILYIVNDQNVQV